MIAIALWVAQLLQFGQRIQPLPSRVAELSLIWSICRSFEIHQKWQLYFMRIENFYCTYSEQRHGPRSTCEPYIEVTSSENQTSL